MLMMNSMWSLIIVNNSKLILTARGLGNLNLDRNEIK